MFVCVVSFIIDDFILYRVLIRLGIFYYVLITFVILYFLWHAFDILLLNIVVQFFHILSTVNGDRMTPKRFELF